MTTKVILLMSNNIKEGAATVLLVSRRFPAAMAALSGGSAFQSSSRRLFRGIYREIVTASRADDIPRPHSLHYEMTMMAAAIFYGSIFSDMNKPQVNGNCLPLR